MINICIMGNSHVGSLKRGWDVINKDYHKIKITFFAQRSDGLKDLVVQDGKLSPNNNELSKALEFTSGGRTEIVPNQYDIFIIYGANANVNFDMDFQFYSKAVIEASLRDFVTSTLSFSLLQKLKSVTNKSVYIGHVPLIAATQIQPGIPPDKYLARVKLMNEAVYHPLNAELVKQPAATIVNGNNTHPDFSKGSKRLAIGDSFDDEHHPEDDMDHMNDLFGSMWLEEFFKNYIPV